METTTTFPTAADYLAELRDVAVGAFAPGADAAADEELAGALSACMDGLMGCGIAYDAAYNMTEETLEAAYLAATAIAREEETEAMLTTSDLLAAIEDASYANSLAWLTRGADPDAAEAALDAAYLAAQELDANDRMNAAEQGRSRAHADFRAMVARRNAAKEEAPASVPAPIKPRGMRATLAAMAGAAVLGIATLTAVAFAAPQPTDNFGIPYTPAQANAMAWAEQGSFGGILNPGADAGVLIDGRYVQLEFIPCAYDPAARWFEDGTSVNCDAIQPWQDEHNAAVRAHLERAGYTPDVMAGR